MDKGTNQLFFKVREKQLIYNLNVVNLKEHSKGNIYENDAKRFYSD